jgi:SAM-dependent methyltransferase
MKTLYEINVDNYEKYVVLQRFTRPARDTAKIIVKDISDNTKLLDIGTGSGIVLSEVKKLNRTIQTFGQDDSEEMLQIAAGKNIGVLIKCKLPEIPFPNNYFDAVSANFVLSHVFNHEKVIYEVSRILKPTGKFVFTSWSGGQNLYNSLFYKAVTKFISTEEYKLVMEENLPSEDFYGNASNLNTLLSKAGIIILSELNKSYSSKLSLGDYLNCRLNLLVGKHMHQVLSEKLWTSFQKELTTSFRKEVGDTISYQGKVRFHICERQ